MKQIFEFDSYRDYLREWVKGQPRKGRGGRSAIAFAAQCQLTYVSRVFGGRAELSLEQASLISGFLGHGEEEHDYFMLLVQHARAGSDQLRRYFRKKLDQLIARRLVLKERFKVKMELSGESQTTYYSHWKYVATHILLSIPKFQSRDAIAAQLGLPPRIISEVLSFLIATGLATEALGKLGIGETRIHLGADSPLISKHHTNWRMKSIQSLDTGAPEDLHYSSVVSLAEKDLLKVRTLLVNTMEQFNAIVRESPEETMKCLTLDFFDV